MIVDMALACCGGLVFVLVLVGMCIVTAITERVKEEGQ